MRGASKQEHCIKTWSKSQGLIARSSAESKVCGSVRAECEALGVQTLGEDVGEKVGVTARIDSSAAKKHQQGRED